MSRSRSGDIQFYVFLSAIFKDCRATRLAPAQMLVVVPRYQKNSRHLNIATAMPAKDWRCARTHAPAASYKRSAATEGASSPLTGLPVALAAAVPGVCGPRRPPSVSKTGIVSSRRSAHAITSPACLR
ncbi:unnamed protein product [Arctogadus glacialis]